MAAQQLYKSYLRLCEKWGVDSAKKGRDLGEFIRQQVGKEFSQGGSTNIQNLKECEQKLASLNRLANNQYGDKYRWTKPVTASTLSLEECQRVLSTAGLQEINENKLSLWEKMKQFINKP
ncbi:hypothetical protein JTE90_018504 [Oedothorax gibbosus]|uniref:Mitochondrial nucleoid factor 1 n=1 Tax=Oedothorax gibbosus TaxID=931172 RepID=A0AAV6UZ39_9ARAC|nr:hypothetical protein JTE90_018504 [Oedothorax gibbosus]